MAAIRTATVWQAGGLLMLLLLPGYSSALSINSRRKSTTFAGASFIIPPMGGGGRSQTPHLSPAAFTQAPRVEIAGEAQGGRAGRNAGGRRGRGGALFMQSKDYYDILGVSRSATKQEIKKAYRKLALRWHPDVCKEEGASDKFKEVNKAYEALIDEEKRARYDRFGEAGVEGRGFAGGPQFVDDFDIGDIFDSFFGGGGGGGRGGGGRRGAGGRRAPQVVPGDDLRLDLSVPFKTSIFGAEEKVRINHLETCKTCSGSGAKKGSPSRVCGKCQGNGIVVQVQRTAFGIMQTQVVCDQCDGTGEVVAEKCGDCKGAGALQTNKQIKIDIPAGVQDGTKLRIKGEGDAGQRGGPPGDLYVFLSVEADKRFRREGIDLYSDVSVDYLDAILGSEKAVPTADGKEETIQIPSGTQPNTRITLKGKGVPRLGQPNLRGDQIVNVVVDFPTKLSSKEKELLQKLRAVQGGATGVGAAAAGGGRGGDKGEGKEKKGGWFGGL